MTVTQYLTKIDAVLDEILDVLKSTAEKQYPPSDGQRPGCLPNGYGLDSLLTITQFAKWRQKSVERVRNELPITPGVVGRGRKDRRVHPRTYLDLSTKRAK